MLGGSHDSTTCKAKKIDPFTLAVLRQCSKRGTTSDLHLSLSGTAGDSMRFAQGSFGGTGAGAKAVRSPPAAVESIALDTLGSGSGTGSPTLKSRELGEDAEVVRAAVRQLMIN